MKAISIIISISNMITLDLRAAPACRGSARAAERDAAAGAFDYTRLISKRVHFSSGSFLIGLKFLIAFLPNGVLPN